MLVRCCFEMNEGRKMEQQLGPTPRRSLSSHTHTSLSNFGSTTVAPFTTTASQRPAQPPFQPPLSLSSSSSSALSFSLHSRAIYFPTPAAFILLAFSPSRPHVCVPLQPVTFFLPPSLSILHFPSSLRSSRPCCSSIHSPFLHSSSHSYSCFFLPSFPPLFMITFPSPFSRPPWNTVLVL